MRGMDCSATKYILNSASPVDNTGLKTTKVSIRKIYNPCLQCSLSRTSTHTDRSIQIRFYPDRRAFSATESVPARMSSTDLQKFLYILQAFSIKFFCSYKISSC